MSKDGNYYQNGARDSPVRNAKAKKMLGFREEVSVEEGNGQGKLIRRQRVIHP